MSVQSVPIAKSKTKSKLPTTIYRILSHNVAIRYLFIFLDFSSEKFGCLVYKLAIFIESTLSLSGDFHEIGLNISLVLSRPIVSFSNVIDHNNQPKFHFSTKYYHKLLPLESIGYHNYSTRQPQHVINNYSQNTSL